MDWYSERENISKKLSIGKDMVYLPKSDCENMGITKERVLELVELALTLHGQKRYEMPAKIGVHPYTDVFYHAMPAYIPSQHAVGMKWIECYPQNPVNFSLPQTTGLLILNDVDSGCPIAVMDCTWLTTMRTPAVTVLTAAKLHPHAESFGMFGCGVQGIEHIRFVTKTLKHLKHIYVYDVIESAMDRLIKNVQPEIDVEISKGKNPQQLAKTCDVLSSATIIVKDTLSIVKNDWITNGQTILPCDLNSFWDPKITHRADKYIVDSIDEHKLFCDMGYFPNGLPNIYCETGEIIANMKAGRIRSDELIVCSNIGMAVCDIVLAKEIFSMALDQNKGSILPL